MRSLWRVWDNKMGMIIFLTAGLLDFSLAVFCLFSKSNQIKLRSSFRIASLACFVLLAISLVIKWSFRYYALALLLLILSTIGVITLIRGKNETKKFNVMRVVLKAVGMTALLFVVTLPAILFPQNIAVIGTTGEYQVSTQMFTYTDQNRLETYVDKSAYRKLNVQMWYPNRSAGLHPLVVFSHGGLGVKSSNESLYNELASHGYVVCSIDHTYQCFYTTDENGETTFIDWTYMQELSDEDPLSDIQQSYELYQKWMNVRMNDIEFVIDHVIAEAGKSNTNPAYALVDTAKIGVMGHSLGGSAALGIGRIREDVSAVIALESPYMFDIEGVEGDRFIFTNRSYPIPVLNVYSDSAWDILSERQQYKANYAMLSNSDSDVYNVHISGIGHMSLTDFALTSPILTRFIDGQKSTTDAVDGLQIINKVCLEFFNSYLN